MSNIPNQLEKDIKNTIEVSIRLVFLIIIVAWCLYLLLPFISPVIWGVIIAVSTAPLYDSINRRLKDKPKLTSFIIVILFLAVIIIPSYFLIDSLITSVQELGTKMNEGTLSIPPPGERVKEWPLIGQQTYDAWSAFSSNLEKAILKYDDQVTKIGKWLIGAVMSLTGDILMFILAIIVSGILLATRGTNEVTRKFFKKLVGSRGDEFADLSDKTIRNVTKGILGVAFIQATLLGILFLLAGVPYAGIWAMICLVLGIIQLPPTLVSIPVIIYLYSAINPTMATVWTVLIILASISDNVLKPILLGKGAPVPMLVIFLGAIGGFMLSGFLGLFTGAIVLSLGYKLFLAWLYEDEIDEAIKKIE